MRVEASAGRKKESVHKYVYKLTLTAENDGEGLDLSALFHLVAHHDVGLYECIDRELRCAAVERGEKP